MPLNVYVECFVAIGAIFFSSMTAVPFDFKVFCSCFQVIGIPITGLCIWSDRACVLGLWFKNDARKFEFHEVYQLVMGFIPSGIKNMELIHNE